MDKTKKSPIPEKTAEQKPAPNTTNREPQFVRGTADPSTKK